MNIKLQIKNFLLKKIDDVNFCLPNRVIFLMYEFVPDEDRKKQRDYTCRICHTRVKIKSRRQHIYTIHNNRQVIEKIFSHLDRNEYVNDYSCIFFNCMEEESMHVPQEPSIYSFTDKQHLPSKELLFDLHYGMCAMQDDEIRTFNRR